jgi:hypothetical protein
LIPIPTTNDTEKSFGRTGEFAFSERGAKGKRGEDAKVILE